MQFLRALFWLVVGIAVAVFTVGNWRNVTLDIWGGMQADVKIPVLVLGAFLLGFLPMWIAYRYRLWREGRARAVEVHEVGVPVPVPVPSPTVPASAAMAPVLDERTDITPDGVMHTHAGHGSGTPAGSTPVAGGA